MTMDCKQFEESLTAMADGGATASDAARVNRHLESCEACRQSLVTQTTARTVLRARAAQLSVIAPPGLRTRIAATARDERQTAGLLSWGSRLSAFSAAAVVVLVLGGALLPVVTARSTVLLAAQMALDHIKCFSLDGHDHAPTMSQADAEAAITREHGWSVTVPPSAEAEGLVLLAVRRCLYGDGFAAHVLYRVHGQPVSLFVMPGLSRPAAELGLLGHEAIVWTEGDRTYMVVAGAETKDGLARVASYLQNEAR